MSLYTDITNEIIAIMETAKNQKELWGTLTANHFGGRNHITGAYYSGVNALLLASSMHVNNYTHNEWMTIAQARALGYFVEKGAVATRCTFYKVVSKSDLKDEEDDSFMVLKSFNLFNIDQFTNKNGEKPIAKNPVHEDAKDGGFKTISEGEKILAKLAEKGANIQYKGKQPCYIPCKDIIVMPQPEWFTKPEFFYSVLYHEASHWTGAKSRLNRDLQGRFGDAKYAMEELIAELSSAFICARTGIIKYTLENHACYLKSWIDVLKKDPKAIFKASSLAQKAQDFITA